MRKGRKKTEEGLLLETYARERGITLRAAQNHRAAKKASWVAWCQARAGVAAPGDLQRAEEMRDEAWRQWIAVSDKHRAAVKSGVGAQTIATLGRAASAALARYTAAQAAAQDVALKVRALVPRGDVDKVKQAVGELGAAFVGMRSWVASRLPDEMLPAFYDAWGASVGSWNAAVEKINETIEGVTNVS